MAKETNDRKDVTFYLLDNIGGNLRTRLTRIYFSPTNRKIEGRTAGEDRYPDAIAIEFNRGTYTTSNPDVIEFLRLYSFGWVYHKGQPDERTIIGNIMTFFITEDDPTQKTIVKEVVKTEIEQVFVIEKAFAQQMDAKMLEQYAISRGVDLTNVAVTKASLIDKLIDVGFIK